MRWASDSASALEIPGANKLHLCAFQGSKQDLMQIVIYEGMHVDSPSRDGWTPLHVAVDARNLSIVEQLIALKADTSCANTKGTTPLMIAATQEGSDTLKLLIQSHANIDAQNAKARTALHKAMQAGRVDNVAELCKAGADLYIPEKYGYPPAYFAVFRENRDTDDARSLLKVLATFGADFNRPSGNGDTLLIAAAEFMENNVLEYLIERNPKLLDMKRDTDGYTALHAAVNERNQEAVEKLCEAGANVNAQNSEGYTPLMIAVAANDFYSVSILQNYHADPTITSSKGTALEIAKINNLHEMIECISALEFLRCKTLGASRTMEALSTEMMCSICLDVARNPRTVQPCEHSFCSECIQRAIEWKNKCPTCRGNVKEVVINHMLANVNEVFFEYNLRKHPLQE